MPWLALKLAGFYAMALKLSSNVPAGLVSYAMALKLSSNASERLKLAGLASYAMAMSASRASELCASNASGSS